MPNRRRAFAVIAIAVFISTLDLFIVNIAFPQIRRDFAGADLASLSWVLNGYAIVFAALLVVAGKLGDLVGRRRVFVAGLLAFVSGSALCAIAPSLAFLVAARVLQGAGAAAITPTSLGLVLPLFPAERRAAAIGGWAAIGGVGAAMGPPLGGLLVEASWRWIFLVNVPLGLASAFMAHRFLREIRDPDSERLPDGAGAALLVAAIGALALGIVRGPDWGWDARVVATLGAAGALAVLFAVRSLRHPAPVLEPDLMRAPVFALAAAATLLFFAAFGALLLANVLFVTEVWRWSVLQAGFALTPGPIMAAVFAVASGRLAGRFGPAPVGAPGGLLFAVSALWLAWRLGTHPHYVTTLLPSQLIAGSGIGLMLPAFTTAAVSTLAPARLATGIGAQTTFRQIGAALGVATWVAIVGTPSRRYVVDAFDHGYVFMAASAAASALVMLATARAMRSAQGAAPSPAQVTTVPAASSSLSGT